MQRGVGVVHAPGVDSDREPGAGRRADKGPGGDVVSPFEGEDAQQPQRLPNHATTDRDGVVGPAGTDTDALTEPLRHLGQRPVRAAVGDDGASAEHAVGVLRGSLDPA